MERINIFVPKLIGMKIFYYLVIVGLAVACSESEETGEGNTDNKKSEKDSTITETIDSTEMAIDENEASEEEEVSVTTFDYLEDYTKIKNRPVLISLFPETYKNDTTWVAEGTRMMLTTHITNRDNGQQVTFYFDPEEDVEQVSWIQARYTRYDSETYEETGKTQMKSKTGMYLGMPLKELHELNGAPITFAGFGWDFGGNARAHEGKLKDSDISFMLDTEDYSDDSMIGDVMFTTEDGSILDKPIFVESMTIYY